MTTVPFSTMPPGVMRVPRKAKPPDGDWANRGLVHSPSISSRIRFGIHPLWGWTSRIASCRGRRNLRKGMPQRTMTTPINAGSGSCIRIRKATSVDKTMKPIGATGNHHPLTGSFKRKRVDAASARKMTAEKDDVREHPVERAEEKHRQ